MSQYSLVLSLPGQAEARTVATALMDIGLNVDILPKKWPGAVNETQLTASGQTDADVDATLAPLRDSTHYEVVSREQT